MFQVLMIVICISAVKLVIISDNSKKSREYFFRSMSPQLKELCSVPYRAMLRTMWSYAPCDMELCFTIQSYEKQLELPNCNQEKLHFRGQKLHFRFLFDVSMRMHIHTMWYSQYRWQLYYEPYHDIVKNENESLLLYIIYIIYNSNNYYLQFITKIGKIQHHTPSPT